LIVNIRVGLKWVTGKRSSLLKYIAPIKRFIVQVFAIYAYR